MTNTIPDYKFEVYLDLASEYRWRVTSSNGNIVGASSQGYTSKENCLSNAKNLGIYLNNIF